jgi:hypothetical protein
MSLLEWWRTKSGKAKTIAVLCTLLILQIGLCFGTQPIVDSFQAIFHIKLSGDDEFGPSVEYMIIEAILAGVTSIALAVAALSYIIDKLSRPKE